MPCASITVAVWAFYLIGLFAMVSAYALPFCFLLELSDLDISWLLPFRRTLDLILIVVTLSLNDGTSCWLDFDLRPMEPTLHLS